MGRFRYLLLAVSPLWAQSPRATLLAEVREKMIYLLASQPNYTCLETIERTRNAPGGGSQIDDTLRLEVALVDGKEMFAWPGAKSFEDRDIRELASTGMFGNGNYAIYARMLFNAAGPDFTYAGQVPLFGLQLARYDFRVPRARSGYHLSSGDLEAPTGFHGSIYVDPARTELRRLEVAADDIPAELGIASATDRVDYATVVINDETFLLPVESNLQMSTKDVTSRNRTRFSGCRKFAGESSLIFDDPEVVDAQTPEPVREVDLPGDSFLTLEILSDLRLESAAIGDSVTAVLRSDIKRGKEVIVKRGATVRGRLIALERTRNLFTFGLSFQELEWKGGHARLNARIESLAGFTMAGRSRMLLFNNGIIQTSSSSRSLRGESIMLRTVR